MGLVGKVWVVYVIGIGLMCVSWSGDIFGLLGMGIRDSAIFKSLNNYHEVRKNLDRWLTAFLKQKREQSLLWLHQVNRFELCSVLLKVFNA